VDVRRGVVAKDVVAAEGVRVDARADPRFEIGQIVAGFDGEIALQLPQVVLDYLRDAVASPPAEARSRLDDQEARSAVRIVEILQLGGARRGELL
jgi:hypothetical protein